MDRSKSKVYKYLRRHIWATVGALVASFFTVLGGLYFFDISYPNIEILKENQVLRFVFPFLVYFLICLVFSFAMFFPLLAKTVGRIFGSRAYKYSKYIAMLVMFIGAFFFAAYIVHFFDAFFSFISIFFFVYVFLIIIFTFFLLIFIAIGKWRKSRK